MAVRARRLTTSRRASALALPLVIVAVAALVAFAVQRGAADEGRARQRDRDRADVARFGAELDELVATTKLVAAAAAGGQARFIEAANATKTEVGFALVAEGQPARIAASNAPDADVLGALRAAAVTATVDRANSDGRAHLAAPVTLGGRAAVAVAVPTVNRRDPSAPVVVSLTAVDALRHPSDEPALWGAAPVRVTTEYGTFGPPVRNPVLDGRVRAGDIVWAIGVGPSRRAAPVVGWLVVAAGLVIAAAAGLTQRRNRQLREIAEHEVEVRTRQLETIARTSAALQQSLNLGEVLPAFAVDIADEFALSAVSVLVADADGRMVEIFRYGRAAPNDEVIDVELRRGWRTVGRLCANAPVAPDAVTGQSLRAIGDLLAIAVSNAQLYEREQQAVARLSELDALKNAFLGTVSHELRTATTAVLGFGDLLNQHWDSMPDERRREMAGRIRRQAGSLRHLVDDLLDYARLERESLSVNPRQLDLSDVVRNLTDSMSPIVADHTINVEAEPGVTAWADPIAVERIVANLLSNAGKYSPAGTTVTVRVVKHGDRARLAVADQGPGIPEEERRRVFVRFYRLSNAATISSHGAGIGLAILRDFAERSGALVAIDDAPGGGALITVDFPTAPLEVPA